jgi:hypothetical protein
MLGDEALHGIGDREIERLVQPGELDAARARHGEDGCPQRGELPDELRKLGRATAAEDPGRSGRLRARQPALELVEETRKLIAQEGASLPAGPGGRVHHRFPFAEDLFAVLREGHRWNVPIRAARKRTGQASTRPRGYLQSGFLLETITFCRVVLSFPRRAIFPTRSQPHTPTPKRT